MNMITKFLLSVLLLSYAFAKAQKEPTQQDVIKEYLSLSNVDQEMGRQYNELLDVLKTDYHTQTLPNEIWKTYQLESDSSVSMYRTLLVSEYQTVFKNEQDLKNLVKFYKTPAGIQYRKNPDAMSSSQQSDLQAFMKSSTGKELFHLMPSINKTKRQVFEKWSKEVRCRIIAELDAKGFPNESSNTNCK
jgi:hypothetical protein